MSQLAHRSNNLPVKWVLGALCVRVKWQRCETDPLPPSCAMGESEWSCTSAVHVPVWHAD